MSAVPALLVTDVAFAYPDGHAALDGVDLEVPRGQRMAMLGPNGAGKSTLALHLNGIHRADRGTVHVDGLAVADRNLARIRRSVGMVFQDTQDQLFMPTVAEDVAFGPANLGATGSELDDRVHDALARVGAVALADRAPHHLSGGERRRVALATVLAMDPTVLVLDEPTAGLDPSGRRDVIKVLDSLDDVTQVVITHDLSLALELCTRAVVMNAGRIVADADCIDVLTDDAVLTTNRLELPLGFDPRLGLRQRDATPAPQHRTP